MVLDTLAARTSLPPSVVDQIREKWLNNDKAQYGVRGLYIPATKNLDECDIIFEFVGADGEAVSFRCTASRFLMSPWKANGIHHVPIKAGERPVGSHYYTLGVNFYWAAFVHHEVVFAQGGHGLSSGDVTEASVRLAAQRLLNTSGQPLGEEKITFHDHPGRLIHILNPENAHGIPLP
ncbi:hypothetical protein C8Q76DRAFT_761242 [Earliella scabrosa]|nr:hypothetical protein C8Q76DRAFT_761242 [Earliella scabrosa]